MKIGQELYQCLKLKGKIMNKYRIISREDDLDNTRKYYIQKRRRFLFWKYWSELTFYYPLTDSTYLYGYDSLEEARKEICRLTTKNILKYIVFNYKEDYE